MPKPIHEFIGDDEALADWCEAYKPSEADEVPVAEYFLECAAEVPASNEQQLVEALSAARAGGTSWSRIGEVLGISGEAAQQRYALLIEDHKPEAVGR